jgi:hypothetical protein
MNGGLEKVCRFSRPIILCEFSRSCLKRDPKPTASNLSRLQHPMSRHQAAISMATFYGDLNVTLPK